MLRCLAIVSTVFLSVLGTSREALAIGGVTFDGTISRGANVNEIKINVKVDNSSIANATDAYKNLSIILEGDSTDPLPVEGTDVGTHKFQWLPGTAGSQPDEAKWDLTLPLTIKGIAGNALKTLLNGGSSVRITIKYKEEGMANEHTTPQQTISVSASVADEAPANFKAEPGAELVTVTYTPDTSIAFKGVPSTGAPSSAVLVVIDTTSSVTSLPAMLFSNDAATADTEANGACTYDPDFVDGTECIACGSLNYLDTADLKSMSSQGLRATEFDAQKTTANLTKLEAGREYAVFMYYEPGGLQQTTCRRITPYTNRTLAELTDEGDAKYDNPRCFVATAAYGSPLHKNLKLFRWFRDNVLQNFSSGRAFVDWYYENGPAAASVVAAHPALALGVRTLLWPAALLISLWLTLADHDLLAIAAAVTIVAGALALTVRRLRD